ncbi:pilus assembly protein TadG-related protein [Rhizobium sp. BE258]|uniref:pilus assembly protein TadG-related protein n=1 Tax=Rhizobium sp. BE258 TaxID=2817722 RepID=UPI00285D2D1B|nr:pilus assembly protein TadG-related protein [Rhizobium sp. BE258]MDR7146131.1 Flp pilus assembly protein TadG [Rhizobium sp. BE258]
MSPISLVHARAKRMLRDRSGNFGMMTAILVPVALGAAGVAVDVSNTVNSQRQLQEAADSSALATAAALADGTLAITGASAFAKDFVAGQMSNYLLNNNVAATGIKDSVKVTVDQATSGKSTTYNVNITTTYNQPLSGLANFFGVKSTNIGAASAAQSGSGPDQNARNALSMVLALDESGSMAQDTDTVESKTCTRTNKKGECKEYTTTYVSKIAALKSAAGALFDALDGADKDGDLVRTGAVSYTHIVMGQTSPIMSWGTAAARKYVAGMPSVPAGGTDANGAMVIADNAVRKPTDGSDAETKAHAAKKNMTSDRYLVLMSDGEMTGYSNTWNSSLDQKVRDKCDAAKSDGITIFTVAFMAPDKGKKLLQYCASSAGSYYEPNTMEKLVKDFQNIAQTAMKTTTRLIN